MFFRLQVRSENDTAGPTDGAAKPKVAVIIIVDAAIRNHFVLCRDRFRAPVRSSPLLLLVGCPRR